jgi:hypothetical protein
MLRIHGTKTSSHSEKKSLTQQTEQDPDTDCRKLRMLYELST